MPIKFVYRAETPVPVEIEGLTPDWACEKSLPEIERFAIFHGNRKLPLAEMFSVSGDASDKQFEFEGNLSGVHWIGAQMRSGQIRIHGPAGRHLGSEMRGGEIHVAGDAGGWVGCEMRGGLIHVRGSAGHLVGAAYRGSAQGMRGGTILVEGDAGNEVGLSMQQGTIAIVGAAGDMLGFNMAGGTVLVLGDCGIRVGAGMRGGAIGLFGAVRPPLLPTFCFERKEQPGRLVEIIQVLHEAGLTATGTALPGEVDVHVGDLVAAGSGEIHLPCASAS